MSYNSGSNRARNFKSASRSADFEITRPIVLHLVQLLLQIRTIWWCELIDICCTWTKMIIRFDYLIDLLEGFSLSHWSRTCVRIRTVIVNHRVGLCLPCWVNQPSIFLPVFSSISRGGNNAIFTCKILFSCSRRWWMPYCKRVWPTCYMS